MQGKNKSLVLAPRLRLNYGGYLCGHSNIDQR